MGVDNHINYYLLIGVYAFGELLENKNIMSLEGTEHQSSLNLLKIFAYGTYSDYKSESL